MICFILCVFFIRNNFFINKPMINSAEIFNILNVFAIISSFGQRCKFLIFMIFTFILCSFVSAQEFNNQKSENALSDLVDVLVTVMVPLILYVTVDYTYDKKSKSLVNLVNSLVFFIIVGLQQEIAFIISPDKISITV